jgi:hypothetical protein
VVFNQKWKRWIPRIWKRRRDPDNKGSDDTNQEKEVPVTNSI